jgi:hypothetical protein
MKSTRALLTAIVLLLAVTWQAKTEEKREQVVLLYQQRSIIEGQNVDIVAVPKKTTVYLGLVPLDSQAELPAQTIMLCSPMSQRIGVRGVDGRELGPLNEIGFKCGGKRYLFTKLDLH